jgi:hypothetical protein
MIEDEKTLHDWISHYMKEDANIKRQIEVIDSNLDNLFTHEKPQPPDFEL